MTADQPQPKPQQEFNIEEFSKRIGVILDVEFSMIRQNKRIELHRRVCDIAEVIAGESRPHTPAPDPFDWENDFNHCKFWRDGVGCCGHRGNNLGYCSIENCPRQYHEQHDAAIARSTTIALREEFNKINDTRTCPETCENILHCCDVEKCGLCIFDKAVDSLRAGEEK
jgi:hypothetical protein